MLTIAPSVTASPPDAATVAAAVRTALARIAPLWPLRHFVAVNPFLGLLDRPFADACALLQRVAGAPPLLRPNDYLAAYDRGEIAAADLSAVADDTWSVERLLTILRDAEADHEHLARVLTVAEELDADRPHPSWSRFIVDEISKWGGVLFDRNQTTWRIERPGTDLFATWRASAAIDRNPEVFGLRGFRAFVAALPRDPDAVIHQCIARIAPTGVPVADFLHRQLLSISGWAGHVQYLVREDALRGQENPMLRDLLAIRLAYDAGLHAAFRPNPKDRAKGARTRPAPAAAANVAGLVRWQRAYELGYQRHLAGQLAASAPPDPCAPADRPAVQAIFCIDVRSELLRRHLEAAAPLTQTLGFAGFFGFPVAHRAGLHQAATARCPALLVPPVHSEAPLRPQALAGTRARLAAAGAWKAFQNSAISCFSFVEAVGLGFSSALADRRAPARPTCDPVGPRFAPDLALPTRINLAENALRNMSLTRSFARLVLVCGHGSASANNPYASSLDCGACGGHAGDVNARLAAATFNDPAVRRGLAARGIAIPADTWFIAGLHNTTTDDVTLCDLDALPASHVPDVRNLRAALVQAAEACRAERAPSLGLSVTAPDALQRAFQNRARDTAEVRPEWGLANNAALIAAPRHRTARLKLSGRVFLHDYHAAEDPEDKVLTLILTAPVVVASWINLQYYASRVDPERYGSGDKTLHNIVGGLGALEGNGGDLRAGLPLQSLHDGLAFRHEPRRLSVFVAATRPRLDGVLRSQPDVARLFDHDWIHLFALEGQSVWRREPAGWTPFPPP